MIAILFPAIVFSVIGIGVFVGFWGLEKLMDYIYKSNFEPYKLYFIIGIVVAVILMIIFVVLLIKSKKNTIKIIIFGLAVVIVIISVYGLVFALNSQKTVEVYQNYLDFLSNNEEGISLVRHAAVYSIVIGLTLFYAYAVVKESKSD